MLKCLIRSIDQFPEPVNSGQSGDPVFDSKRAALLQSYIVKSGNECLTARIIMSCLFDYNL